VYLSKEIAFVDLVCSGYGLVAVDTLHKSENLESLMYISQYL